MTNLSEDQKKALVGLSEVAKKLEEGPHTIHDELELEQNSVASEPTQTTPDKFIQILVEDNLPQINFVGMQIPEVLGILEMSKQLILEKRVVSEIKKQNYQQMLELGLIG